MKKFSLILFSLFLVINTNFISQASADTPYPAIMFGGSNSNNGINKSGNIKGNFEKLVFPSRMYSYNYVYSGSTFSGADTYMTAYIHDESKSSVNYAGKVLKSTDGVNYREVAGNADPLVAIASDYNGTIVAAGGMVYPGTDRYYSVIMTSKDNGETFTTTHSSNLDVTDINQKPTIFGGSITKVYYLNNTFFTIGNAGTNLYMLKSEDGVNWQQVGTPKYGFISGHNVIPVGMEYSNGKYVIALTDGRDGHSWEWVATSSDAVNWKSIKIPVSTIYDSFTSLVLVNDEFVLYGNKWYGSGGFIMKSIDGETWSSQQSTNIKADNVVYDSSSNLCVGSYANNLLYSLDGLTWTTLKSTSESIRTLSLNN
ncbi:hypothetical protein LBW89_13155 [Paenibacillus sp. alder61]|uniref:Exo-alpha-sialidase n=1 Tax=Paenibacillus faecis TaxID=862114 RepID=A0A5D0CRA1_9BACL|nr:MULTISPECIES: hypothetical protein [Paenibacillus]MCA1293969.1 hypothetical protein [Paenibacillus sp. alder61]TYA11854.1 hypothetical protein FRY98_13960 [Paenibacillus faecis]